MVLELDNRAFLYAPDTSSGGSISREEAKEKISELYKWEPGQKLILDNFDEIHRLDDLYPGIRDEVCAERLGYDDVSQLPGHLSRTRLKRLQEGDPEAIEGLLSDIVSMQPKLDETQ